MSFHALNNSSRSVGGRPRCEKTHLVALEYLMHPGKRPWGLFKQLAAENGLRFSQLNAAVERIKSRVKENQ